MRKLIHTVIVWCLLCGAAFGQAVNPQNTFSNAVNINQPSLWLNYNDPTSAFKDQVSGNTFVGTQTVQGVASAGTHCISGNNSASSMSCTLSVSATDTLVVIVFGTVSSVVDSGGSTPVLIATESETSAYYFANVSAGSHTITVTLTTVQSYISMQVVDVVGAATSSPLDTYVYNVQTTSTKSVTSGSLTTSTAGDLLVGMMAGNGVGGTWSAGGPAFSLFPIFYTDEVGGTYVAGVPGSYSFNATSSVALGWNTWLVAIKAHLVTDTSGTVTTQQPGFDATNNANYSAAFPYNGFTAAPNNTLGGSMEWKTPWTMLNHIDRLNWDRTGTLVLASKGDLQGCVYASAGTCTSSGSWWKLVVQPNTYNANASQLCFERNGTGAAGQAQQVVCTDANYDAMPNGFNYDIVVEDSGTGQPGALTMWINGSQVGTSLPGSSTSLSYANGFGSVALAVTAGGSGYAATTNFTSTGGGANCVVTGTATATSGVITSIVSGTGYINAGCTSNPTIVLTSPTGTGATFTATSAPMSMNSTTAPLMAPGYLSNGVVYGVGGTDAAQNPVNSDEFAIFPGNLTFGQITNIFYETKFYQSQLFPNIPSNPPLVIFEGTGCGPDFSGDQSVAMVIGAARAGLIRLVGMFDDDGNANGINSVGWWRQMLDQAGLADVPLSVGASGATVSTGGCPAASITAYNASTPQNPASYESAVTMLRTLFAKYPTAPIDVLLTKTYNGYAQFLASPADGISSLTGAQLQAQNATNGGWISFYEGNISLDTTDRNAIWTTNGPMPIWVPGGVGGQGGPGILASRTANDPLYMAAVGNTTDTVNGYTNQDVAQVLSPYFNGGVTVAYSGGTGYANATPFTSKGGGPYCHVTGIMTASSGDPNGIQTSWGASFPSTTTYNGLGYGCSPATFTATGSGTNLTVSSVAGVITIGDTISGTGIPAGTTIAAQTSGTPGGAGVYTTSVATTASAATVTRTPTVVLTSPTGTGVMLTSALTVFLNAYSAGATNTWSVWPSQYDQNPGSGGSATTAPIFSWFENSLMDPPVVGQPIFP